jgi:hypothetical protein
MRNFVFTVFVTVITAHVAYSQVKPTPSPTPSKPSEIQQRSASSFDLSEYGVQFQTDARLIVMMAALEAAGLNDNAKDASVFRLQVQKDLAELDTDLRNRLRTFYDRNKLPAPATQGEQAARYVSLALTLGQPPTLDAPERSDDLPGGLLEVLDFVPLLKEFYRRSGIEERLVTYTRAYQAEGDRLRPPTEAMLRDALSYLHTRPITVSLDKVLNKAPAAKKNTPKTYTVREHQRNFFILPDLLAPRGAINFRVIGDDYYVVVPQGTDPTSSEMRRAYLLYVIDPLMIRFNREIAERREPIKQILAEREKAGGTVSPDVFLTVSRSLVAAADARYDEVRKLENLSRGTRSRLLGAKDDATRTQISKEAQAEMNSIQDATIARLADDYERGAVLDFFFADQLKGIESSGFDIANFFPDMIASFDPARETRRPAEYAEARKRANDARQARLAAKDTTADTSKYSEAEAAKAAGLVKRLSEIEEILKLKDYTTAESRLNELFKEYPREPRIFFALAQTSNLAAQDATDEDVQSERLKRAVANYRLAVHASSPDTDRALISRAHEAMGRIYAFLENNEEAAKEFDAAINMGEVRGGAYKEALVGKERLKQP